MPENLEQSTVAEPPKDFAGVLDDVMAEVLATMFFTEAEPAPCDHGWLASSIAAKLVFEGTHVGETVVTVSRPVAESIASGFIGVDPAETSEADANQVI